MSILELKCCPKCGDIKFTTPGEMFNCGLCGCLTVNTGEIVDYGKIPLETLLQLFDPTRQQYTLNSPQFDQAAWDRRVGIENGTIKVPEKPEPKPVPKCPTCGSTDVHRISTLNRGASVDMWGLFSGKIGKNYECENCKARW